jgi:hypothetical protein
MATLHPPPSVVLSAPAGSRLKIHLLESALADVGYKQIVRQPVKAEAPRVPQAARPDFRPRATHPPEWIIRRNAVRQRTVHVDPEHLSQQCPEVLGPVAGISLPAAIAKAKIQISVRPEKKQAAVVIGERLIHPQNDVGRLRIGTVGIRRYAVAGHDRIPTTIRVVNEEEAVSLEPGMKGHA